MPGGFIQRTEKNFLDGKDSSHRGRERVSPVQRDRKTTKSQKNPGEILDFLFNV